MELGGQFGTYRGSDSDIIVVIFLQPDYSESCGTFGVMSDRPSLGALLYFPRYPLGAL